MKLEEVQAEIRPRSEQEAIDMGLALTRRYIGGLSRLWACTVLPISLFLVVAFYWAPGLGLLIWVWISPLFERLSLFHLSRALFGQTPTVKESIRETPALLRPDWWKVLTYRRISWSRALYTPVLVLEGLRGKSLRERTNLILRQSSGAASLLTFTNAFFTMILWLGLLFFVVGFMPTSDGLDFEATLESIGKWFEIGDRHWMQWVSSFLYMIVASLLQQFHVGAGFALYLNARTRLEGWDVELGFRRLSQRLKQTVAKSKSWNTSLFLVVLGLVVLQSKPAFAVESEVKTKAQEILRHRDFEIQKEKIPKSNQQAPDLDVSFLSAFLEWVFWSVVTLLLGFLLYRLWCYIRGIGFEKQSKMVNEKLVTTVMGLDLKPENLPEDIVATARKWWDQGERNAAVALLYRGSLSWWVNVAELAIEESDTEGDCLMRSKSWSSQDDIAYFGRLTQLRLKAAYSSELLDPEEMRYLCEHWRYANPQNTYRSQQKA